MKPDVNAPIVACGFSALRKVALTKNYSVDFCVRCFSLFRKYWFVYSCLPPHNARARLCKRSVPAFRNGHASSVLNVEDPCALSRNVPCPAKRTAILTLFHCAADAVTHRTTFCRYTALIARGTFSEMSPGARLDRFSRRPNCSCLLVANTRPLLSQVEYQRPLPHTAFAAANCESVFHHPDSFLHGSAECRHLPIKLCRLAFQQTPLAHSFCALPRIMFTCRADSRDGVL